ncbi:hypothetical protein GCM10007216_04840 [Thalassobacillus devorans]|uniref:Uncharacterized protein n=1 Tax=Thalassobacillus devorans TaxID=279813 RepID=A0ABQ1NHG0_9BACI|nr:hypothetical protein [Thalassobacillus devorans]NIK27392.1 hypothetical protein [Thalassobacillus devorans]GGC77350.1 hypothetical protein GCM10007216_04840 [Thalassobacillus devorans]
MAFIIIAGFILPWVTGVYLYKKAPKIFYTTAPITALIAVVLNQAGIHLGLWEVNHMPNIMLLDSLFLDLGIFTIAGAWFTYILVYKRKHPILVYSLFIGGMVTLEGLALLQGTLSYAQEWSFIYTILMYIGGFLAIGAISRLLIKLNVYP